MQFLVEMRILFLSPQQLAPGFFFAEARQEFGGMDQVKEDCRDARGTRWIEDLGQDSRCALRLLVRNPAFAAIAIATLALGIGISQNLALTHSLRQFPPSRRSQESVADRVDLTPF